MKKIIIIHGCPSNMGKALSAVLRTFDKHWIPWLKKELKTLGVEVNTPLMPSPWNPVYNKFKMKFDKYEVTEETTLIGHSCGCAFLVRWLGDSKQKIDKLILVAPWKIADADKPSRKDFYEYPIDESIKSRVNKVVIFTSDNEHENGKKSVQIFKNALAGHLIELKNKGHYTMGDMGTDEFPELLDVIVR
jgi:predicted alpha/beta hydrolase family esterase